jgi:nitrate/nitrite-specific signal transduction histidine kinase
VDVSRSVASDSAIDKPEGGYEARAGWRVFKNTLRFKLPVIIVGVVVFSVLFTTALLLNLQRQHFIKTAQSSALTLSNTIESNLNHAMLSGDWKMINNIIEAVVAEGSVDALRILDEQGVVSASSVAGETGTRLLQDQAPCNRCHVSGALPEKRSIVFNADNNRQVLLTANPIENQPECYGCHIPATQVLGMMMIETPLTAVNQQLNASFWRINLIALVAVVLLIGLIVPALDRYVLHPVKELSKGVSQIKAGNLDFQIPVVNQDELGDLAEAFDDMRQQLKKSQDEMARREHELATLNEVGLAATQLLDLQEILEYALDTVVSKLGMAYGMVFLWDEIQGRYTLRASHGITEQQSDEIDRRRRSGWDITKEVAESGKEVFVANMASDKRFHGIWDNLDRRSYVNLPLSSRGTVVGVMGLITPVKQTVTQREVEFLKAVGREIGIAIDNAILLAGTQRREQQAMTLFRLGTNISSSLALTDVLEAVCEAARELTEADVGLVGLFDEDSQEIIIRAAAGVQKDSLIGMRIGVSDQASASRLLEGKPIRGQCTCPDQDRVHISGHIIEEHDSAWLAVPLIRGEKFLGLIEVLRLETRHFQPGEAQLLTRLANQVVVSIENAQLYRKLHHLAALEERDRLAREMHDHLAQGLGYLNVKSAMTDELLANERFELAHESLLELKKVVKILYTDVREEIFNLRTTVPERISFFTRLKEYLSDYHTHYGLGVQLRVDTEEAVDFSPEVTGQLLRIIQEALTNVRRHSDADKVSIHFAEKKGRVRMCIEDNGRGFQPEQMTQEGGQHYGIQIMRERAESVGGRLELDSQPGQGTRIVVWVPPLHKA